MRKTRRPRRTSSTDRSATVDVVSQLECAFRNPRAALLGALLGGLVPWFGRSLAHDQLPAAWASNSFAISLLLLAVIAGCGIFSGISVYKFGRAAFGDSRKALGFVLALEGVMLVSTGLTSAVALMALIAINAIANGSVIALAREATQRRAQADARRVATRTRNKTEGPVHQGPRLKTQRPAAQQPFSQALVSSAWRRATLDNIMEAEVISEERLPS